MEAVTQFLDWIGREWQGYKSHADFRVEVAIRANELRAAIARRYEPEALNGDGWTDWIKPLPGYILECCDCGSLHEMQFRVDPDGAPAFRAKPIDAIAMEARQGGDGETRLHQKDDSADPQGIAHE